MVRKASAVAAVLLICLVEASSASPVPTDRVVVDATVNEGSVVGVFGGRIAVTFVPAFMKEGETVRIILSERVDEVVPIVLAAPGGIGGFTLSDELPPGAAAKIRAGMTVRRK